MIEIEPLPRGPFIRDGDPILHHSGTTASGMDYQDKPKRRHILVHQNIRKYFPFVIDGKAYQLRVLQFSLLMAPREFTKTLAPLVQLLKTRGIRVHAYSKLDNQSRLSRTLYSTYTGDYSTTNFIGMDHKLEEVHSRTLMYSRLARTSIQHRTSHCFSTQLFYRDSHKCIILSVAIDCHVCLDDRARVVDALSISWDDLGLIYAFPPAPIVPKTLDWIGLDWIGCPCIPLPEV